MKFSLNKLKPYSEIIYFVIILLAAHFFWKFFIIGDESDDHVTFFGIDISFPFVFMAQHIADVTYDVLVWLGYDVTLTSNNVIQHNLSKNAIHIVWGCTGIKQAYIFFCIVAFYKGPWKHKLWYIPTGLFCIYLFNIFRIILITIIINKNPEQFDLWHEHIMKYAFYALIFLLWVVWNEKFASRQQDGSVQRNSTLKIQD
ncbi:MAG: exosortase/archaeosortase family protein [Paludibacteraceae bacterium]